MINTDYLYNPKAAKIYLRKKRFVDKKAGFQILENATVLPHLTKFPDTEKTLWAGFGGLVDKEGTPVEMSPPTAIYPPSEVQKVSEPTIFLGMFPGGWGHCITYDLSRL